MLELARRTVDVSIFVLWERMEIRNQEILLRCPSCSTLLQLQRRKQWNFLGFDQPTSAPTPMPGSSNPSLELSDESYRQATLVPEATALSPSHPRQPSGPKRFQPVPSDEEPQEQARSWEIQSLPLWPFALGTMLIAIAAVGLALFTPFGRLVTPLSISAAILGLVTLAVAVAARWPLRWPALAAGFTMVLLLLVVLFPSFLGHKFAFYRHPERDPDFTFVSPRRGFGFADMPIPRDSTGADASRFGLDRDWFHIQINSVSAAPVEVRPLSSSGPSRTESFLTIAVSYGSVRNSKKGPNPTEDQCGKLTVVLCDARGEQYERQDLVLASLSAKAKNLGGYASGTIEETLVFAVPSDLTNDLRLEITVPPLSPAPLTFTIPKSMISTKAPRAETK